MVIHYLELSRVCGVSVGHNLMIDLPLTFSVAANADLGSASVYQIDGLDE